MTKSAARRAIAGGCNARVFSQTAPMTSSLQTKLRAGADQGAGPFIYSRIDEAETKPLDKPRGLRADGAAAFLEWVRRNFWSWLIRAQYREHSQSTASRFGTGSISTR
jgi:hypothetical protein